MPDVHDPATRSRNMAAIKGKNTRPELLVRRGLHGLGLRYRLHVNDLLGKPDLVFTKYDAVLFVHGCFWHGHDCSLFRLPATRTDYWRQKVTANIKRDRETIAGLHARGWRTATVWECALRGRRKSPLPAVLEEIAAWLKGKECTLVISGHGSDEDPATRSAGKL